MKKLHAYIIIGLVIAIIVIYFLYKKYKLKPIANILPSNSILKKGSIADVLNKTGNVAKNTGIGGGIISKIDTNVISNTISDTKKIELKDLASKIYKDISGLNLLGQRNNDLYATLLKKPDNEIRIVLAEYTKLSPSGMYSDLDLEYFSDNILKVELQNKLRTI